MRLNPSTFCCSIALVLAVFSAGCRNQCGPNQPWRPFAQSTIIAPPSTYSMNIPGANGQQPPYYAPTNTAANPFQTQPNNANQPNQGGWGPANTSQVPPGNPLGFQNQNNPNLANPNGMIPTNFQIASGSTLGSSRVISPDFVTTQPQGRIDPSRMPISDASQARSPIPFQQPMNQPRTAYNQLNGQLGFNGAFQPTPQPNYNGNTSVLAQSTTGLPNNANYQNGWRSQAANPSVMNR